jgi:hypothetical protein
MGWMYAFGGRSLFLAVVFHAMYNTCWKLFPNSGSHFNPSVTAIVLALVTLLIVVTNQNAAPVVAGHLADIVFWGKPC